MSPAHDLNARIFAPAAAAQGASEIVARTHTVLRFGIQVQVQVLEQASWSAHDMVRKLDDGSAHDGDRGLCFLLHG